MAMPQYKEIIELSDTDISKAIIEAEKELIKVGFKKATRQRFKPHEMVRTKRRLAQLKQKMMCKDTF